MMRFLSWKIDKYFFVVSHAFPLSNDFRNSDRLSSLVFCVLFCEIPDEIDCFRLNTLRLFFLDPCRYTFLLELDLDLQ